MIRAAVVGAAGYAGGELVPLLAAHPEVEVVGLFGSAERDPVAFESLFVKWKGRFASALPTVLPADPAAIRATTPDVALLATPPQTSIELTGALIDAGVNVLDLSGAFRLADPSLYPDVYGFAHSRPDLLASAVYGLPELNRAALLGAPLIALPGCYPTSIILASAPLVRAGAVDGTIIADATSGVSGAGRAPSATTHFCEVSLQPYQVLAHRHEPEIATHAGADVVFTPHLGPFKRGILATVHVPLAKGWDEAAVRAVMTRAYADEPFVRLCDPGTWPSIEAVAYTPFADIGVAADADRRHAIVFSAIDNLLKGAAAQAVQAMNACFGLPETLACLPEIPLPCH